MPDTNTSLISKIKIGETIYNIKDAVARMDIAAIKRITDALGTAANENITTTGITQNGTDVPLAKDVYSFVKSEVASIAGAMHFRGTYATLDAAKAAITDPAVGDVILVGTAEYIYGGTPADWQIFGDEGVYETKANAESTYVKKTLTIAGIDLTDAITDTELKAKLGIDNLGDLAYADQAEATLTDYATGITGASYTPAGSITVTAGTATSTAITSTGDYTPAGAVALAKDNANGVAITGTVAAPDITVTPTTGTVVTAVTPGTLPSFTPTAGTFATEGMKVSVDTTDTEMLVFGAADIGSAIASAVFNAGTQTSATTGTAMTGATATASAPAFTGDKFSATFTGTKATVSVDGNYDKMGAPTATFTGTAATITPTLTKGSKTVTVDPVAKT